MMRRITTTFGLVLALCAVGALGCAHSNLDESWGDAYRASRDAMIENPQAGAQAAPEGLDPRSAEHVLENYSKGQRAQEHPRGGVRGARGILIGEMK